MTITIAETPEAATLRLNARLHEVLAELADLRRRAESERLAGIANDARILRVVKGSADRVAALTEEESAIKSELQEQADFSAAKQQSAALDRFLALNSEIATLKDSVQGKDDEVRAFATVERREPRIVTFPNAPTQRIHDRLVDLFESAKTRRDMAWRTWAQGLSEGRQHNFQPVDVPESSRFGRFSEDEVKALEKFFATKGEVANLKFRLDAATTERARILQAYPAFADIEG